MLARRGPVRVLLLAALLLAASPGAASAFSKGIWGPANRFPLYKQLGVQIYEVALNWPDTAPTRPRAATNPADPAYHWPADIRQAVEQAAHYHMRVLIQLTYT